jgi:hypothetical protein
MEAVKVRTPPYPAVPPRVQRAVRVTFTHAPAATPTNTYGHANHARPAQARLLQW